MNHWFCISPMDALIGTIVRCGLCCSIPIGQRFQHFVSRRITVIPQWRAARRGDAWRRRVHADVFQDCAHLCSVSDERNQAHLAPTYRAQQRKNFVDVRDQNRPQVMCWCALGWHELAPRGWNTIALRAQLSRTTPKNIAAPAHHTSPTSQNAFKFLRKTPRARQHTCQIWCPGRIFRHFGPCFSYDYGYSPHGTSGNSYQIRITIRIRN